MLETRFVLRRNLTKGSETILPIDNGWYPCFVIMCKIMSIDVKLCRIAKTILVCILDCLGFGRVPEPCYTLSVSLYKNLCVEG